MSSGQFSLEPVNERNTAEETLSLPALEVRQGYGRVLYSFAVDGKKLPLFAAVSRIHRDGDAEVEGYQRPRFSLISPRSAGTWSPARR